MAAAFSLNSAERGSMADYSAVMGETTGRGFRGATHVKFGCKL